MLLVYFKVMPAPDSCQSLKDWTVPKWQSKCWLWCPGTSLSISFLNLRHAQGTIISIFPYYELPGFILFFVDKSMMNIPLVIGLQRERDHQVLVTCTFLEYSKCHMGGFICHRSKCPYVTISLVQVLYHHIIILLLICK